MARNLRRFPPKPLRSASFIRSLAGSEPGLRMNTMGEFGELCSSTASKLITGGCTYLVKDALARVRRCPAGQLQAELARLTSAVLPRVWHPGRRPLLQRLAHPSSF